MAPQLWRMQLDAGAWGITAATSVQARTMRAFGVRRILIANELTDSGSIRWAAEDLRDEANALVCYVDSRRGVELLERELRAAAAPRPLPVVVELGYPGGRTGCRDVEEAMETARAVVRSGPLELAGVAGYEGTIAHDREPGSLEAVGAYLESLREFARRVIEAGFVPGSAIVTAGGSLYFDLVAERLASGWPADEDVRTVLRSGCYLTHDAGVYERSSPFAGAPPMGRFRSAIEAWGVVLSRPEPGLALIGLGKRDVPSDLGYPRPLEVRREDGTTDDLNGGVEVTLLNDQHAYCRLHPGVRLAEGDLVRCGISHPCTAFDRWRVIPVLDDDDRVVDAVATFF
jgi:D-serine deaminase-like pyridoxal phosphate-dependent protein